MMTCQDHAGLVKKKRASDRPILRYLRYRNIGHMYLSVLHEHVYSNTRCYGKGEYTRSRFANMFFSIKREHVSDNTRCYGNGRTRIVFAIPVFVARKIALKYVFGVLREFAIVFDFNNSCNKHNIRHVHALLQFTSN